VVILKSAPDAFESITVAIVAKHDIGKLTRRNVVPRHLPNEGGLCPLCLGCSTLITHSLNRNVYVSIDGVSAWLQIPNVRGRPMTASVHSNGPLLPNAYKVVDLQWGFLDPAPSCSYLL
jgi:hypothetical protein